MTRTLAALLALFSVLPVPTFAQDMNGRSPTTRGLLGDSEALTAARAEAVRAGLDCEVTAAALRARGDNGDRQYEVACRDGPGYLILTRNRAAVGCMFLASQNARQRREGSSGSATCRLRQNRNLTRHYGSFAAQAGVTCRVDGGRVVGLTREGGPIYEIGCRNAAGAWIEQDAAGWRVSDCLEVQFRGDVCELTTQAEELAAFGEQLLASPARACAPKDLRSMGRNTAGQSYVEVVCDSGDVFVARLDGRRVGAVLSCADAAHVGDGCRAVRPAE